MFLSQRVIFIQVIKQYEFYSLTTSSCSPALYNKTGLYQLVLINYQYLWLTTYTSKSTLQGI